MNVFRLSCPVPAIKRLAALLLVSTNTAFAEPQLEVSKGTGTARDEPHCLCVGAGADVDLIDLYTEVPDVRAPYPSELVLSHRWDPLFERKGFIGCVKTTTPGPAISKRPRLAREWSGVSSLRTIMLLGRDGKLSKPAWNEVIRALRPFETRRPEKGSGVSSASDSTPSDQDKPSTLSVTSESEKLADYFVRTGVRATVRKAQPWNEAGTVREYIAHLNYPGEFDDVLATFSTVEEAYRASTMLSVAELEASGLHPLGLAWRTWDADYAETLDDRQPLYYRTERLDGGDERAETREKLFFRSRETLLASRLAPPERIADAAIKALRQEPPDHGDLAAREWLVWEKRAGIYHEYTDYRFSNEATVPASVTG